MRRSLPPLPLPVFAALAVAVPLAGWALHHDLGHDGDLRFFHRWALAFADGPAFYRDGPGVNYPILGALLVCAPAHVASEVLGGPLDEALFRTVHKAVLVAAEVAQAFAAARLAARCGDDRPRWVGLAFVVLPSSWAGGASFGQTDVVGTVALLVAAEGLLDYRQRGHAGALLRGVLALHAAFLLKQLTWFAIPPLFVLLLHGLVEHRRARHAVLSAATVALWFVADPWLVLPDGRVSHLFHVVTRSAGDHGALLVANGASVWVLLRDSGLSPADPWLGPVTPGQLGWGLWVALTVGWTASCWRRRDDVGLVAGAGVASLAMALFLTGVHERYLAHAVPFLFLATSGPARAAAAALGCVSGAFVLSSFAPGFTLGGRPGPVMVVSLLCLGLMATREWVKIKSEPRA